MEVLEHFFKGISNKIYKAINDYDKSKISKDDFVDAACLGISAWLAESKTSEIWPEKIRYDEENLPMAIYLPPNFIFPIS